MTVDQLRNLVRDVPGFPSACCAFVIEAAFPGGRGRLAGREIASLTQYKK